MAGVARAASRARYAAARDIATSPRGA